MPTPARPTTNLDDAVKVYEGSDLGYQSVADQLNVPRRLLKQHLVERGTFRTNGTALARARGEATRMDKRAVPTGDICDDYLRGVSEAEIARIYGVSRATISTALRKANVPRRGPAEANRLMMSKRSPEENLRNTQAAHEAVRGRRWTVEERLQAAQRRHGKVSTEPYELLYSAWLRLRGVDSIPQHAIGPYNCDLAVGDVAVEIFGGHWHGYSHHASTFTERARYILDQGWNLVIVWVDAPRKRLAEPSADYIVAFVEESRRDPSMRGEYRVIWGDGQEVPTAGRDLHEFAAVPPHRRRP
jgi:very-short-patch-repair endonuclease